LIVKDADGTVAVTQAADQGPLGTAVGLVTGSLVGLLGGPVGLLVGAATGTVRRRPVRHRDHRGRLGLPE
jgi:uncharacterized membrane protein